MWSIVVTCALTSEETLKIRSCVKFGHVQDNDAGYDETMFAREKKNPNSLCICPYIKMAAPSGFSARQRFSLFAHYVTLKRQNAILAQICCY